MKFTNRLWLGEVQSMTGWTISGFTNDFTELYALRKAKREILKHIASIERDRSETV
jgi:hypothetical protein